MPLCKSCRRFFEEDDFTNPDDGEGSLYCPDCVNSGDCYRDEADEEDDFIDEFDEELDEEFFADDDLDPLDEDLPDDMFEEDLEELAEE